MLIRIEEKEIEDAAEEVRRERGDKSRTETVRLLILEERERRRTVRMYEPEASSRAKSASTRLAKRKGAKS
jgi:hypothetical protein